MTSPRRALSPHSAIAALAVAASAGAALYQPLAGIAGMGAPPSRSFAAAASAAVAAVCVLPFVWNHRRMRPAISLAAAVVLLGAGVLAALHAGSVQRRCTARLNGRTVLVGTELTETGRNYMAAFPDASAEEILDNSRGDAAFAWTRESIEACRSSLASTYFWWIPLVVSSLAVAALAVPRRFVVGSTAAAPAPAAPGTVRYDVFLSYRHGGEDGEAARQLLEALEADGQRVAIDERDFAANASFLEEMERCIRESRFTVAIVSPRYLESGHCSEEAILCKVLDMGERRRRLIPFVIAPVTMPTWLYGIVGIDCTRPDPLVEPIERLKQAVRRG